MSSATGSHQQCRSVLLQDRTYWTLRSGHHDQAGTTMCSWIRHRHDAAHHTLAWACMLQTWHADNSASVSDRTSSIASSFSGVGGSACGASPGPQPSPFGEGRCPAPRPDPPSFPRPPAASSEDAAPQAALSATDTAEAACWRLPPAASQVAAAGGAAAEEGGGEADAAPGTAPAAGAPGGG